MKPLLYHLEYHIQNGYFDRFPKGQAIKLVVGNDGGIQTLYGRGTGSGRVMFSSGKSVLFAMDKSREELKVVFRAYSEDKCLGEAVKIFKGTSFPKRTEVGEPASYTFGSDLGFRKGSDLIGAIKSFIRITSFGENIISDCIKDGDSYRVRMTSLIVERNKDPRKNVKPWWVILDGRRLRFSRWLRTLEKENCTKDVFLKVNKCSDVDNLPGFSESSLNEEEQAALATVEAALEKDFESIREFGSQETYDKGSQVNFFIDPSIYALQIDNFGLKSTESCRFDQNKSSSLYSLASSPNFEDVSKFEDKVQNIYSEIELSSTIKLSSAGSCSDKRNEFLVPDNDKNIQNKHEQYDLVCSDSNQATDSTSNVPQSKKTNDESTGTNYKKMKPDDIFHFERSTSDVFGENASTESSGGVASLVSEELRASDCEVESPIVTDRSFLAETIVREIIDIIIERVFEREYCSLEEHPIEDLMPITKEESSNKVARVVGHGDTESLMDLSVLGIAKTSACVDLSLSTSPNTNWKSSAKSLEGNEEDKKEQNNSKTIFICSSKKLSEREHSNEECSSKSCKENEYIRTNDLKEESDVSCVFIKCSDQNKLEDHLYNSSQERTSNLCSEGNGSNEGLSKSQSRQKDMLGGMWPSRSSADNCISEWLKEDVITPCFTCDKETKDDVIHGEGWKRTIIAHQTSFVESADSVSLPRPEDECRPDVTYLSDELHSFQVSSKTHHSYHDEPESIRSCMNKSSIDDSLVSQETMDISPKIRFTEKYQDNEETSKVVDIDSILNNRSGTWNDDTNWSSPASDNISEHDLQI